MVTNFENLKMNIRGNDPQYVFSNVTSVILSLEFHGDDVSALTFCDKLKISDCQLWMQASMQQCSSNGATLRSEQIALGFPLM